MTTKLTLSMDENAIQRGKQYARNTGRSLSRIVEDYLTQLDNTQSDRQPHVSLSVTALMGIGQGSADENDYKQHLAGKHAR